MRIRRGQKAVGLKIPKSDTIPRRHKKINNSAKITIKIESKKKKSQ
jgi:hypothetical protein